MRAELARAGKTAGDMAIVIGVTPHTAGRRLRGITDFTAVELVVIAKWLGIEASDLLGHQHPIAS